MARPVAHRFTSFLDRFSERLEVDCERLKCELVAQVDQQFGVLRSKVCELSARFGGASAGRVVNFSVRLDDPQLETVSLDDWIEERCAEEESLNTPSTSTGHKRKSTAKQSQFTNKLYYKRQKSDGSTAGRKFVCKFEGCDKSFPFDVNLARHERIHMNIKPFSRTWPDCRFLAVEKGNVVQHVRIMHFKLPQLKKEQTRLNIVDNRDPEDFIRVDNQLLERRLE